MPQYKTYCSKCDKNPMSNPTRNNEYVLGYHPGTDKSVVCPYCGIGSFAHRHKAGSLPKDFKRLNTPFNDLPAKDQKGIIRGAKKLQDEVLHENWETKWNNLTHFIYYEKGLGDRVRTCVDSFLAKKLVRELLADARKENVEDFLRGFMAHINIIKPESSIFIKKVSKVLNEYLVLVTLREEESK